MFNQNINNWDVSKVTSMNAMFRGANRFNQPLQNWNTNNCRSMNNMFENATIFDQNIKNWKVDNVGNNHKDFEKNCALRDEYNPFKKSGGSGQPISPNLGPVEIIPSGQGDTCWYNTFIYSNVKYKNRSFEEVGQQYPKKSLNTSMDNYNKIYFYTGEIKFNRDNGTEIEYIGFDIGFMNAVSSDIAWKYTSGVVDYITSYNAPGSGRWNEVSTVGSTGAIDTIKVRFREARGNTLIRLESQPIPSSQVAKVFAVDESIPTYTFVYEIHAVEDRNFIPGNVASGSIPERKVPL